MQCDHTVYHLSTRGLGGILDEESHPETLLVTLLGEHAAPTGLLPRHGIDADLFGHLVEFFPSILESLLVRAFAAVQPSDNGPCFFIAVPCEHCARSVSGHDVFRVRM